MQGKTGKGGRVVGGSYSDQISKKYLEKYKRVLIIITWILHELQVQGKPGKGGWVDGGWQLGTNGPPVQLPVSHTLPSVKQA